jgi:hypothetical protein
MSFSSDANTNTKWADDLLRVAVLFDTLDSLDPIDGGILARKIGEGYRELDIPPKARKGKASLFIWESGLYIPTGAPRPCGANWGISGQSGRSWRKCRINCFR